jgi:hypothetical protein
MVIQLLDASKRGLSRGWDYRRNATAKSLLIHTTNGHIGTMYESERNFIYYSDYIKAHYLVGKKGQVTKFLDIALRAWHAGAVNDSRFNNNNSVGIECHYTPGEGLWTPEMHSTLDELVRYLIKEMGITSPEMIETHRAVATPKGRKIDPSGFSDAEFYVWRSRLFEAPQKPFVKYRVISAEVNIRTSPHIPHLNEPTNIVGKLTRGDIFESEALKVDEYREYVHGINTWAHLTRGVHNGKPVDSLGFIHTSNLTIIS